MSTNLNLSSGSHLRSPSPLKSHLRKSDDKLEKIANSSYQPMEVEDCAGGTYILYDQTFKPVAVFKPTDEEPGAIRSRKPNSPVLLPPGNGSIREVAAYILDQNMPYHSRAGVPETILVNDMSHPDFSGGSDFKKSGSLQLYIENEGCSEDFSPSMYSTEDVQRIAILDLRIMNIDRNSQNILVTSKHQLVPIDHTFSLPETIQDVNFEWLNWPQAKTPIKGEFIDSILAINVFKDAHELRNLGISEKAITTMILSTLWLKIGAASGYSLYEIAKNLTTIGLSTIESILKQDKR